MEETSLIVKRADGATMRPIGVVKNLRVNTFGLTYKIWFVIMDFGNQLDAYDIILGRPYMRMASLIDDWLTNIIYLQKDDQIIKVDLQTWKHRPLNGHLFAAESDTIDHTILINIKAENKKVKGIDQDIKWYKSLPELEYSHNWTHLLATIDLPRRPQAIRRDHSAPKNV